MYFGTKNYLKSNYNNTEYRILYSLQIRKWMHEA